MDERTSAVEAPAITYRLATPRDIMAVAALRYAMETERHETAPNLEEYIAAYRSATEDELAAGRHRVWLAEANGQPVGCALLIWWTMPPDFSQYTRKRGLVSSVYVQPDYRRRGIARQLMTMLMDWARVEGFQRLILSTSNMGRPLYEDLGFVPSRGLDLNI